MSILELPIEIIINIIQYIHIRDIDSMICLSHYSYKLKDLLWRSKYNRYMKYIPYYLKDKSYEYLCKKYLNLGKGMLCCVDIDDLTNHTDLMITNNMFMNYKHNKDEMLLYDKFDAYHSLIVRNNKINIIKNNYIDGSVLHRFSPPNLLVILLKDRRNIIWLTRIMKGELYKYQYYIDEYDHNIMKMTILSDNELYVLDSNGDIIPYNNKHYILSNLHIDNLPEHNNILEDKNANIYIDIDNMNNILYNVDNNGDLIRKIKDNYICLKKNVIKISSSKNGLFISTYKNSIYKIYLLGKHPSLNSRHAIHCRSYRCECINKIYSSLYPILLDVTNTYITIYTNNLLIIYKDKMVNRLEISNIKRLYAMKKYLIYFLKI